MGAHLKQPFVIFCTFLASLYQYAKSEYPFDGESHPLTEIEFDNNLFGSNYDRLWTAALMRRHMFSSQKVISHEA